MIRRIFRHSRLLLTLSIICSLPALSTFANEIQDREYLIKAGLLLKFSEFIQWPETYGANGSHEEPINICIKGKDNFQNLLTLANDADIIRRNILVRNDVPLSLLKTCHIVFISISFNDRLNDVLDNLQNAPVLVISESEGNGQKGVGINFIKVDNKVRFEINHAVLTKTGLKVSSELINLAILVFGDGSK